MGSRSTKNIYNNVGFLHEFLEKWKWGAQNALFCCRFLSILEQSAGISVPNGPRARKPRILIERQAADLGVFLGKSPPETINIP